MWRPEWWSVKRPVTHILRLGQSFVQLWREDASGWTLLDRRPVHNVAYDQHHALVELVADIVRTMPETAPLQILADTKWIPISLLLTGELPLSKEQAATLAKHRFAQVFGDQANSWRIQTTYVAGDAQTLAFACPANLKDVLSLRLGKRMQVLAPSLSWAWNHFWRSAVKGNNTWLALAEQDRSILVWLSKGQVRALQATGPLAQNSAQLGMAVRTEALRCGVPDEVNLIQGASFEAMPSMVCNPASTKLVWRTFETTGVNP